MKAETILFTLLLLSWGNSIGQSILNGQVKTSKGECLELVQVFVKETGNGTITDSLGRFSIEIPPNEKISIQFSRLGFQILVKEVNPGINEIEVSLVALDAQLDEVVVSGTLQEISRLDSPVPVEVYKSSFFRSNPAPSLFESFQNINGIRSQVNCNICNTGNIQINGLAGPYTMILIDGMPIVSGLATVYGLSGIPQALVDRVEVVKGPASTIYGSEAVAGLINIITKKPEHAPAISMDAFGSTWGELNLDLGIKSSFRKKIQSLMGFNSFWYDNPIDNNRDGMTDLSLQRRISIFQKLQFTQKKGNVISLAGRYIYEDRWGGQMNWSSVFRGGDLIYGESIRTKRWELFGNFQLPVKENLTFQFSANGHNQDSYYGNVFYGADQRIGFGQLTWNRLLGKNQFLGGAAYRVTYYDDSTPATAGNSGGRNSPFVTHLPGLFFQNEFRLTPTQSLLGGIRYDYNTVHGSIWSPRLNYKLSSADKSLIWRSSIGNGFRVVNVFTEDHAALTGARRVIFEEKLEPERSWNINTNLIKKIYSDKGNYFGMEGSLFYTTFTNQIIPDYEANPNQIIYSNLEGTSKSQGMSLNFDGLWANGIKFLAGVTLMDVSFEENERKVRQLFTERFSGVWTLGYHFHTQELTIDYTGNIYSPMRLPLLGELDTRPEFSPWWSIQNIQITKGFGEKWQIYVGLKNILNYTPPTNSIARAFDPFDRGVVFDGSGSIAPTPDNPNALSFDPSYLFAPNQGIRGFFGVRFTLD